MKKTLNINLNGRAFNIDEDAYRLLENYLNNLKIYFREEIDALEIISDFEARISELFNERIRLGYDVVSIEQVESAIAQIGNPEDFEESDFDLNEKKTDNDSSTKISGKKKFFRNIDNKWIAGICSGIATYIGCDPLPIRIVMFILLIASHFWLTLIYLLLWIFIPAAITASQKLEMKGEAITLENIGKIVSETANSSNKTNNNNGCLDFILKTFLAGVGCLIGIPLSILFIVIIFVLIAMAFGFSHLLFAFFSTFGLDWNVFTETYPIIGIIALAIVIGIPLFSILYAIFSASRKTSSLSKTIKWTGFVIWILAFFVLIFSGMKLGDKLINYKTHWHFNNSSCTTNNGILIGDPETIRNEVGEMNKEEEK